MGITSPFVGATQSPLLWTPHSVCQKTPQSLLPTFAGDYVELSSKYDNSEVFNLGLPAIPLVQVSIAEALCAPALGNCTNPVTLSDSQVILINKNTFLHLPASSNDASPDLHPRRRSQSDWTGMRREDASVLLDLCASTEVAQVSAGTHMPEWSLPPPAAAEEECVAPFSSALPLSLMAPTAPSETNTMVWQCCGARPDVFGGGWIVPWSACDPALERAFLASASVMPAKSEGSEPDDSSTIATLEGANSEERRIDPDDYKAYTLEELRQRYVDRFSESQVVEYWDCLRNQLS